MLGCNSAAEETLDSTLENWLEIGILTSFMNNVEFSCEINPEIENSQQYLSAIEIFSR